MRLSRRSIKMGGYTMTLVSLIVMNGLFLIYMLLHYTGLAQLPTVRGVSRESVFADTLPDPETVNLSNETENLSIVNLSNTTHELVDLYKLYDYENPLQETEPSELHTCTLNKTSSQRVRNIAFLSTLRAVIPIPEEFEKEYRNPCWYMYISISTKIFWMIYNKGASLTDKEASLVMSEVFQNHVRTLVCIPRVFFIGFPKSGSTQLYNMMIKHPQLVGGRDKEPHWWTRFPFSSKFPHNIIAIIRYLLHYLSASGYIANHPGAMAIDASQSTIWDTRFTNNLCIMPSLISRIVPTAKYIVIMRDPVSRLYSDFAFLCEEKWSQHTNLSEKSYYMKNAPEVFHRLAEAEIKAFRKCLEESSLEVCTHLALSGKSDHSMRCGRVRLGVSLYYVHIVKWLKTISRESFLFLRMEDMAQDPYSTLESVWKFLEVRSQSPKELEDILHKHSNTNPLYHVNSLQMKQTTRTMLQEFFQFYNKELAKLLNDERFLWQDQDFNKTLVVN